ncbi:hypothetical protein SteCoe_6673 [Stentor coeruleus]|uniref:SP-RING-type domain-containing protein n=1 Tax=Stentor coeruleus TaxID=5963 RepID=A0A1R2CPH3_9CILI|nr:hypothetical protein SteCoe_6673 [Stentor coeruleus]
MENYNINNYRPPDMEDFLLNKSSAELKLYCKKLGLSQKGNKEKVVQTIITNLNAPENRQKADGLLPKDVLDAYSRYLENQSRIPPSTTETRNLRCICLNDQGPCQQCSKCKYLQHIKCIGDHGKLKPYFCPLCILEKINPLDFCAEVLISAWVVRQNFSSNCTGIDTAEKSFEYKIATKNLVDTGQGRYQIQIRCLKLDGQSLMMTWPLRGYLVINGKIAMKLETSSNPNSKKRKDEPLNITTILTLGRNTISLIKCADPSSYAVSIYLVYIKSEEQLIEEIVKKNKIPIDKSKEFIKKILKSDDEELISDSIRLSLKCPFTLTLLDIPTRGQYCEHIQCFNLSSYIQMQRSSRVNRWKCPLCKGFVYDMIVDSYLEQIMKEAKNVEEAENVEIFSDSSYRILSCAKEDKVQKNHERPVGVQIELPKKNTRAEIECIDLD